MLYVVNEQVTYPQFTSPQLENEFRTKNLLILVHNNSPIPLIILKIELSSVKKQQ